MSQLSAISSIVDSRNTQPVSVRFLHARPINLSHCICRTLSADSVYKIIPRQSQFRVVRQGTIRGGQRAESGRTNSAISSSSWLRPCCGRSQWTKCVAFGSTTTFSRTVCTSCCCNNSRSSGRDQKSRSAARIKVGAVIKEASHNWRPVAR